jgi:hypothetical protein
LPRKPTFQAVLGDGVRVEVLVLEDLGGVAQHDGGDDRQAVGAHRGDRRHVAGQATGAGGIAGIEAHHASRWRAFLLVLGLVDLGVGGKGCWAHGSRGAGPKELAQSVESAAKRPLLRPRAQAFALSIALSGPG